MTPEEQAEWQYRYDERLALMGAGPSPTPEQHRIAKTEADKAIEDLKPKTLRERNLAFLKRA